MSKVKSIYICQNCGESAAKWVGRCPSCGEWNSMSEEVKQETRGLGLAPRKNASARDIQSVLAEVQHFKRFKTGLSELDLALDGGLSAGSLTLLGGEPGIGKSTLTLQMVRALTDQGLHGLLISGEESLAQVAGRAQRLNVNSAQLKLAYETNLEAILDLAEREKPEFMVIDSIQVMESAASNSLAGSLSQIRTVAEQLMNFVKPRGITTLLIGHVNKEGHLAGPKVLEHLVDTVLMIEGERDQSLRLVRSVKNRFGSVNQVGILEMNSEGLRDGSDWDERVLKEHAEGMVGSCLTLTTEGNRPILVEVQALVTPTHFGYPKRTTSGFDRNRLELLLAVMEKHGGVNLGNHDVYLSIAGGMSVRDPNCDLGVVMAIQSAFKGKPMANMLFAGEIDLSGRIRSHSKNLEKTAQKFGIGLSEGRELKWSLSNTC